MARAASSLPVPDGPVISVAKSPMRCIQRPAIAPHVVREDGLPDCRAQPRRGQRAADNGAEDLLEGALDLPEACESVRRIVMAGKADLLGKEMLPVRQEFAVEAPARCACSVRGHELRIVAIVEKMDHGVFIQHQIRLARRFAASEPAFEVARPAAPRRSLIRHTLARGRSGSSTGRLHTGSPSNSRPSAARSHSARSGRNGFEYAS